MAEEKFKVRLKHYRFDGTNYNFIANYEVGADYGESCGVRLPSPNEIMEVPRVSFQYGEKICNSFSVEMKMPVADTPIVEGDFLEIHIKTQVDDAKCPYGSYCSYEWKRGYCDATGLVECDYTYANCQSPGKIQYTNQKWFTGMVTNIEKGVSDGSGIYEDSYVISGEGLHISITKMLFYLGQFNDEGISDINTLSLVNHMFVGASIPWNAPPIANPIITDNRKYIVYDSTNVEQTAWLMENVKADYDGATTLLDMLANMNTGYDTNYYDRPFYWGIDENRTFHFRRISNTAKYSFELGDAPFRIVSTYGDLLNFRHNRKMEITNELIISGWNWKGKVYSPWSNSSIASFGVQQKRINNRNIGSQADATNWYNGFAYWTSFPLDSFEITLRDTNTPKKIDPRYYAQLLLDGTALKDFNNLDKFPLGRVDYEITGSGINQSLSVGYIDPDFAQIFRERIVNENTKNEKEVTEQARKNRPECIHYTWNGCKAQSNYYYNYGSYKSDGTDVCYWTNPDGEWPNCPKYLPSPLPEICGYGAVLDPHKFQSSDWKCKKPNPPSICHFGHGFTGVTNHAYDFAWCYFPKQYFHKSVCRWWQADTATAEGIENYVTARCVRYSIKSECQHGFGWISASPNLGQACPLYEADTRSRWGQPCVYVDTSNTQFTMDDICRNPNQPHLTCAGGVEHGPQGLNNCAYYCSIDKVPNKKSCKFWEIDSTDNLPFCSHHYHSDYESPVDGNGKIKQVINIDTKEKPPANCYMGGRIFPGDPTNSIICPDYKASDKFEIIQGTASVWEYANGRITQVPNSEVEIANQVKPTGKRTCFATQGIHTGSVETDVIRLWRGLLHGDMVGSTRGTVMIELYKDTTGNGGAWLIGWDAGSNEHWHIDPDGFFRTKGRFEIIYTGTPNKVGAIDYFNGPQGVAWYYTEDIDASPIVWVKFGSGGGGTGNAVMYVCMNQAEADAIADYHPGNFLYFNNVGGDWELWVCYYDKGASFSWSDWRYISGGGLENTGHIHTTGAPTYYST